MACRRLKAEPIGESLGYQLSLICGNGGRCCRGRVGNESMLVRQLVTPTMFGASTTVIQVIIMNVRLNASFYKKLTNVVQERQAPAIASITAKHVPVQESKRKPG